MANKTSQKSQPQATTEHTSHTYPYIQWQKRAMREISALLVYTKMKYYSK